MFAIRDEWTIGFALHLIAIPSSAMASHCSECGADVSESGSCRGLLDALLAREWEIPGGPGERSHFFAVATYGLQHPRGMNYTGETLDGLRRAVADALAGVPSMEDLRRRARAGAQKQGRVTRRDGDRPVGWSIHEWPMTIVDVLPSMTDREEYAKCVAEWARSVIEMLDARHPIT